MHDAFEVRKMRYRSLSLAIRRKQINRGRRFRSAPRPLLAGIDPETSGLRSPATGIKHRDRSVVGEQMVGSKHVLAQPLMQGFQPPACTAHPSTQCRTAEINAMPRKDLRLPVERGVIAVFADQHLRQQRGRRQATGNQPLGRRRLDHLIAGAAGVFRAGDANDTKLCRHPVQHLADTLTDRMQSPATASASLSFDVEQDILARKMIGQRRAPRWRLRFIPCDRRTALFDATDIAVDIFQGERQLTGINALGTTSELHALKLFDDRLETFDLTVFVLDRRGNVAHQAMQKRRVCREIVEIELHVRFYSNVLIRRSNFPLFDAGFLRVSLADHVGSLESGKIADIVVWRPAFFGIKPELVIKGGFIAWGAMGDSAASLMTCEPILLRPQWGAFGRAASALSACFVHPLALARNLGTKLNLSKNLLPVQGTRKLSKRDMLWNDTCPLITVDPETFDVFVEGALATCEPARELPLARRYMLR
jgi:hypothetical protein